MNQDDANLEIFNSEYVSGGRSFAVWLEAYLDGRGAFPFLMGGPDRYDLGDLMRALLPSAKRAQHEILKTTLVANIKTAAERFDLDALRVLAHAVARSGFSSVTRSLSTAIETVSVKLERAKWSEEEKAAAHLATDQIIAALATFAVEGDTDALRVARMLYREDDLAPFSSSLFTPLALAEIKSWPAIWCRLVVLAAHSVDLFGTGPEPELGFTLGSSGYEIGVESAHFDIFHVFQDFLIFAAIKEYSLQDVYDAVSAPDLPRTTRHHAEAVLGEMEERGVLMRRQNDQHDKVFLDPDIVATEAKARQTSEKSAIVELKLTRDWEPKTGRSAQQFEQFIRKIAV